MMREWVAWPGSESLPFCHEVNTSRTDRGVGSAEATFREPPRVVDGQTARLLDVVRTTQHSAPVAARRDGGGSSGSQRFPTPVAETNEDRSTTVHFPPTKPDGGPGRELDPDRPERGFSAILRLYSPLQGFFDKSWQVGEIERARA
jgi:hypothetical protein